MKFNIKLKGRVYKRYHYKSNSTACRSSGGESAKDSNIMLTAFYVVDLSHLVGQIDLL